MVTHIIKALRSQATTAQDNPKYLKHAAKTQEIIRALGEVKKATKTLGGPVKTIKALADAKLYDYRGKDWQEECARVLDSCAILYDDAQTAQKELDTFQPQSSSGIIDHAIAAYLKDKPVTPALVGEVKFASELQGLSSLKDKLPELQSQLMAQAKKDMESLLSSKENASTFTLSPTFTGLPIPMSEGCCPSMKRSSVIVP